MSALARVRRAGPGSVKRMLSCGGGQGFTQPPFWQNEDRHLVESFASELGRERIDVSFDDFVREGYKRNGVVFACLMARMLPFSEALFRYQSMDDGLPGALSYGPGLEILDRPWANGTTGDLLARMEQDASLSGNSYYALSSGSLRRMRPDWVTIVTGVKGDPEASAFDLDSEVLGYIYHPDPRDGSKRPDPVLLSPERVMHYAPIPDPEAQWRGMSWLSPVLAEIDADSAATRHKLKFFENGATSNFVVTYDPSLSPDNFEKYVALFDAAHKGVDSAYKTIHLGGGADAKTVGADLKQLDFKVTQGAGETRIAAASGAGSIIAQLSEGMQGSSLNEGNYSAAKRRFADMLLRPLWRNAAGALAKFTNPPAGSRLWYADRHIDFIQEDAKDSAAIFGLRANSIRTLTDGGYEPDTVIAAVNAENPTLLRHTGKLSVQLTDPDAKPDASAASPQDLVEMIQKIYLGVDVVLTPEEARGILNRAGAGLSGSL